MMCAKNSSSAQSLNSLGPDVWIVGLIWLADWLVRTNHKHRTIEENTVWQELSCCVASLSAADDDHHPPDQIKKLSEFQFNSSVFSSRKQHKTNTHILVVVSWILWFSGRIASQKKHHQKRKEIKRDTR